MAKRTPVIASHVNTSLRVLLAILVAGGARDAEVQLEGYVWPHRAKQQCDEGKLRVIKDSDGEVVAYKRVFRAKVILDKGVEWRKKHSGDMPVMQLCKGRRGRIVPAYQLAAKD